MVAHRHEEVDVGAVRLGALLQQEAASEHGRADRREVGGVGCERRLVPQEDLQPQQREQDRRRAEQQHRGHHLGRAGELEVKDVEQKVGGRDGRRVGGEQLHAARLEPAREEGERADVEQHALEEVGLHAEQLGLDAGRPGLEHEHAARVAQQRRAGPGREPVGEGGIEPLLEREEEAEGAEQPVAKAGHPPQAGAGRVLRPIEHRRGCHLVDFCCRKLELASLLGCHGVG
mmetsp:Transcript_9152/g.29437  ORF Transcript_9152/g.29437 Transcript_9152/m.29437 type:complete len:231 (+) Transcript_9152:225-917(+)